MTWHSLSITVHLSASPNPDFPDSLTVFHLSSSRSFFIKQSPKKMGGCFSSLNNRDDNDYDCSSSGARTAKVITIGGELREYGIPVTAAEVVRSGSSSASSSAAARFVCDSDRLYYEEFIQALDPEEELVDGQIYFVLPRSRLQKRLTASDMAALAVKASLAMQEAEEKGGRRRRRRMTRISPALQVNREEFGIISDDANQTKIAGTGNQVQVNVKMVSGRSESFRRLRRYPSRRQLRKALRSFRIRLSTIHEGAPVDVDF